MAFREMAMNSRWPIPRRRFLKGLGTAMALPLLDAMIPSGGIIARGADIATAGAAPVGAGAITAAGHPLRMAYMYVPNGCNMEDWTPAAAGTDFVLSKTLAPLEKYRDSLNIITGLAQDKANAYGDGGGGHARASATFLTGCHPRKTAGSDIRAGISVDQIAASHLGDKTRLPSLELSCDSGVHAGSCDSGYSCAYQFNLSWRSETMPMNAEVDPRQVFERLFGSGGADSAESRAKRELYNKSILDFVSDDASRFKADLGATDRRKLDEYLSAVREIETRIVRAEQFKPSVPAGAAEPEMFENYPEQLRLMFDMLVLAFQTDSTRISTFIMAHEGSNRPYPVVEIKEGHHDLSHHRNLQEKKDKLAIINRYHITQFAYFIDKLRSIKEGDGTLLDNSMIVYGSGLSNGNEHLCENLPILLFGKGGGTITPGRHIKMAAETPLNNLYRSMLARMGVPVEKVGDSTGTLEVIA
jgi:hypothetical protein